MSIYAQYETNSDLEKEGIFLQIGDAKFRIARAGGANTRFNKRSEALSRPYRRQIDTGTIDQKTLQSLTMEAIVDTVLLGWENVLDREGNPIKFSKAAAKQLFEELPDFLLERALRGNDVRHDAIITRGSRVPFARPAARAPAIRICRAETTASISFF